MTIAVKANPDGSGTFLHNGTEVLNLSSSDVDSKVPLKSQGSLVTKFSDFNGSLSTNGYQRLPNGMLIQWGSTNAPGNGSIITLPITYSVAILHVMVCDGGGGVHNTGCAPIPGSLSTFRVWGQLPNTSTYSADTLFRWLVIGY